MATEFRYQPDNANDTVAQVSGIELAVLDFLILSEDAGLPVGVHSN